MSTKQTVGIDTAKRPFPALRLVAVKKVCRKPKRISGSVLLLRSDRMRSI
jgi:hypothetical protein